MTKRWERALVIGASSGIGEAMARELAHAGSHVALVARRPDALRRICDEINEDVGEQRAIAFEHDVRDVGAVPALFQEIATALGGLDLVVYSSGVMPQAKHDEYITSEDVRAIETNFTGAVAWLNEAARRFAIARSGTIVGISSVAGERGRKGNPVYNATKAALNSYLESLRNRLATRGVTVLTAKPGFVRTPMIGDKRTMPPAISAEEAAHQILAAAASGRRSVFVPGYYRPIAVLLRSIPAPIFERLPVP